MHICMAGEQLLSLSAWDDVGNDHLHRSLGNRVGCDHYLEAVCWNDGRSRGWAPRDCGLRNDLHPDRLARADVDEPPRHTENSTVSVGYLDPCRALATQ